MGKKINVIESIFRIGLYVIMIAGIKKVDAQSFVHPGILHSRENLQQMKAGVSERKEPLYSGFNVFVKDSASQFSYHMQGPLKMIGRNPTVGQGAYDSDANAAHQNAIMWTITGDKRYAEKSMEIINGWSSTLKEITGRDAVLMAGLGPFKMINAAEILRYTNGGWKEEDIKKTEQHFKEVIYPVIKNFAPFANGNWDAAAIKTVMAIGVFCNDRDIFERGMRYYIDGPGNGSLRNYVINDSGQIQESGRDQAHTQLGIGMLAESCAIAWNQGLDLYGLDNDRLLKGFEYVAKFNLGYDDVPFIPWLDRTGKYYHQKISLQARGQLRAVYEQVYNHYVVGMGKTAPFVQQAAEKLRPEGPGRPGADHPGYGTLYFSGQTRAERNVPAAPAGLTIKGAATSVRLIWVPSINAIQYTVKRANTLKGPYTSIATNITTNSFVDEHVARNTQYYYTVTASNDLGESTNSFQQPAFSGLPLKWHQVNIGDTLSGNTVFDGTKMIIEANGKGVVSSNDDFHFSYLDIKYEGTFTVRFVPQPSSQFSQMGLMVRADTMPGSPYSALLIYPGKTTEIEAPKWHTKLMKRAHFGIAAVVEKESGAMLAPAVTYGRLTGYYWLRIVRKGNTCRALVSYDGATWMSVGKVIIELKRNCLLGLVVCSGMQNATVVSFDNITFN